MSGVLAEVAMAVGLLGFGGGVADADTVGPGRHHIRLHAAGYNWTYHVQVPSRATAAEAMPVVLLLHGAGGSGEVYLDRTGWAAKAEAEGFLAVAPDGLPSAPKFRADLWMNPRLWNTGQLGPGRGRAEVDDRAFFATLLDDLAARWPIDADRIYLTGHSNGGGMTFRLGVDLSDRFAALAPVASHYWHLDRVQPAHPRPTLFIVGTDDPFVPLQGGDVTLPWGRRHSPPVADTLDLWAEGLGCSSGPTVVRDEDGLREVDYGTGRDGASLRAIYVVRHGHSWPGGSDVLPPYMVGPVSDRLNATDRIWEFFRDRSRSRP